MIFSHFKGGVLHPNCKLHSEIYLTAPQALFLSTMTSSPDFDLPFLEDPETVKYLNASKLMVLVSSTQESILQRISKIYGKSASCISENDER